MKQTELIMGMPITVEIVDSNDAGLLTDTFDFFRAIDARYSTYKPDSEITQINHGLPRSQWSAEMCHAIELCAATKRETDGYFDIERDGQLDPSGLVKGWSIWQAAQQIRATESKDFYIEAGGDIQTSGHNADGEPWVVGIRNPFKRAENIKILNVSGQGVATSGTYIRGQHIYDPHRPGAELHDLQSLTIVAESIYEADRFATAAFAMGRAGIAFVERTAGLEGYAVDGAGIATFTSGFQEYVHG